MEHEVKTDWSLYRPTFRIDENGNHICVMVPKSLALAAPAAPKPYPDH